MVPADASGLLVASPVLLNVTVQFPFFLVALTAQPVCTVTFFFLIFLPTKTFTVTFLVIFVVLHCPIEVTRSGKPEGAVIPNLTVLPRFRRAGKPGPV